jgi:hypothetical protein
MVSISTAGSEGDKASSSPAMSANGRFIYFASAAGNLAPSNSFNTGIFLHDICPGVGTTCSPSTTAVTAAPDISGVTGYSLSSPPSVSLDGRFVAFVVQNHGVGLPGEALTPRLVVVDTCAGVANCASSTTGTLVSGSGSSQPFLGISTNGRFVAFVDGSGHPSQAIVNDSCLGVANCVPSINTVSVANNGTAANGDSDITSMTADGRFIAFSSMATNMDPAANSGASFAYVRDTCLGAAGCTPSTTLVSRDSNGNAIPGSAASMSADGRFIAFSTLGGVAVRDTCRNVSSCVPSTFTPPSVGPINLFPNPILSATGRFLSFKLSSGTFAVTDTCLGAVGCTPATKQMPVTSNGTILNVPAAGGPVSADGKFVVFSSNAPNIDLAHPNQAGLMQVYLGPTSF